MRRWIILCSLLLLAGCFLTGQQSCQSDADCQSYCSDEVTVAKGVCKAGVCEFEEDLCPADTHCANAQCVMDDSVVDDLQPIVVLDQDSQDTSALPEPSEPPKTGDDIFVNILPQGEGYLFEWHFERDDAYRSNDDVYLDLRLDSSHKMVKFTTDDQGIVNVWAGKSEADQFFAVIDDEQGNDLVYQRYDYTGDREITMTVTDEQGVELRDETGKPLYQASQVFHHVVER